MAEQEAIEKIDEVQNEIDRLNEQASEEILKVCVYVYALSLCSKGACESVRNSTVACAAHHPEMFSGTPLKF